MSMLKDHISIISLQYRDRLIKFVMNVDINV